MDTFSSREHGGYLEYETLTGNARMSTDVCCRGEHGR